MNASRLQRIRNWQSSEFYSRLVMRPLSILVMLVIADWKFLTPNRVTTMATAAKLGGAALLVMAPESHGVLAAVILQLGLLLDHLDGTIARYQGSGSTFGAFYDKVSDAITWLVITTAIGYVAYQQTHDVWMPIAAIASGYALLVLGYMKWIVVAEQKKLEWLEARMQPALLRRMLPQEAHEPPSRTPRQWVGWFVSSILRAVMFEEVDLFFWIGVGLVVGRVDLLCWLLAITQGVQLVIMLVKRGLQARRLDIARQALAVREGIAA
jgi:phosphatidylglycerophosphate synthase